MAIMCVLQDNRSALHLACEHAHKEVAAKLIDCGADVNWVNSVRGFNWCFFNIYNQTIKELHVENENCTF